HRHRHRRCALDRRRGGDGDGVCDPRHRPADRRCHPAPRLSGDPGRRADVQLPLRARQPRHRPALYRARPKDPVLTDATITTAPELIAAAPELPDILPPVKVRRGVLGFARRHPAIAIGGALVLAMVFIAVFAPYLGTVDPTALAPPRPTRGPSPRILFRPRQAGTRHLFARPLRRALFTDRRFFCCPACVAGGSRHWPRLGLRSLERWHHHAREGWDDVDPADSARDRAHGA